MAVNWLNSPPAVSPATARVMAAAPSCPPTPPSSGSATAPATSSSSGSGWATAESLTRLSLSSCSSCGRGHVGGEVRRPHATAFQGAVGAAPQLNCAMMSPSPRASGVVCEPGYGMPFCAAATAVVMPGLRVSTDTEPSLLPPFTYKPIAGVPASALVRDGVAQVVPCVQTAVLRRPSPASGVLLHDDVSEAYSPDSHLAEAVPRILHPRP
ncbi:hypothetical protein U9M48_040607 [Paspalum notatum var. saurae]|uniref:Uncharacterized protein n=1 Tax=Paspalum notatum var. saurae TaxID=547442 RepID=A0AAQ3UQW9_PASNO